MRSLVNLEIKINKVYLTQKNTMNIQKILRQEKKAKKLTGRELSQKSGVTEMTINNTLKDKSNPTLSTISALANVLGFRVELTKIK